MRLCIIADDISTYSSRRFAQEASLAGHALSFTSWKDLVFDSKKNTLSMRRDIRLDTFDAVILRSSADSLTPLSLVAEYCKKKNILLLNGKLYLHLQSANKLRQQVLFRTNGIPCLDTLYGEKLTFAMVKKALGLPFVAKITNGSHGKQVFKIQSLREFSDFIRRRSEDHQLFLFQRYYDINGDYRVFLIGKEVFGAVKRIAPKGEWRTNVRGSSHERAENELQVLALARAVGKKLSIDFAGIDILIDTSGKARLIEINTMAQFKVFEDVFPEINVVSRTMALLEQKR